MIDLSDKSANQPPVFNELDFQGSVQKSLEYLMKERYRLLERVDDLEKKVDRIEDGLYSVEDYGR